MGLILSPKPFLETIPSPSNPKLTITVLLYDVTYLDAMASRKKKFLPSLQQRWPSGAQWLGDLKRKLSTLLGAQHLVKSEKDVETYPQNIIKGPNCQMNLLSCKSP